MRKALISYPGMCRTELNLLVWWRMASIDLCDWKEAYQNLLMFPDWNASALSTDISLPQVYSFDNRHIMSGQNTTELVIERFRILVIGNANAGKTTILEKVCHAKDRKPVCFDAKGNEVRHVLWNVASAAYPPFFLF
jgi:hypothetical protein